jgi:chromosome segregation protein
LLARQQEIENLKRELKAHQLIADQSRSTVAQAESSWQQVSQALPPARQRMAEITRRLHDLQLEHTRLQQQVEQTRERSGRLEQDIVEVISQQEELTAAKLEAEVRFEELDAEIGVQQEAYSEAEMAGEALFEEAETARNRLRDQERGAQEAEFNERGVRARIAELQRNLQLAIEQSIRAEQELAGQEDELATLDAAAAEAGLQDALEIRAEREESLGRVRIEMDTLAAQLREADEERLTMERALEPRRERIMQLQHTPPGTIRRLAGRCLLAMLALGAAGATLGARAAQAVAAGGRRRKTGSSATSWHTSVPASFARWAR